MEAKIEFNEEQISQAIQAAILKQIGEEGRDTIIKQAIVYLTTPKTSHHSDHKETPLMNAFFQAAHIIMEKIVQEEILKQNSEFHLAIKATVTAGVEKWLADREGKVNQVAAKIADAIEKCMQPSRFY
jgi:hypothetical protein